MQILLTFLLRLAVLTVALLFGASLAVAFALMVAIWALRAGWARLTGKPVMPFVVRIDPRAGFQGMYRGAPRAHTGRAAAPQRGREIGDVTDVEPRPPAQ